MDPVAAIVSALVAGATAAASQTATQAIKDAYQALKTILVDTYKIASTSLLEKKPSDKAYREAVHTELKETHGVATDKAVLEGAKAVSDAVSQASPAKLGAWGVDVGTLKAAGDVIAERISGTGGGFKADEIESGGSVRFSDVVGGAPGKQ
jgi:hypothetical protein